MIAENNDKKTDFKKVCSETSFLRCNTKNSSKEAQKRSVPSTLMNQKFSVKVLNKKCSKSMNDLSHQVYWEPQRTKE